MMIRVLVTGSLYNDPTERTAKNGNPFAVARISVLQQDGDRLLCSVIVFDDLAVKRLMQMKAGSSVAVAGTLKIGTWTAKDGITRPSLDLIGDEIAGTMPRPRKAQEKRCDDQSDVDFLGGDDEY